MAWLKTHLVDGPSLTLVTTKKEFRKALKDCGVKKCQQPTWIGKGSAQATTNTLEGGKKGMACIVTMGCAKGLSGIDIVTVLVHESVHVFQSYCAFVGEDEPSIEFQAYATEAISYRLIEAYAKKYPKFLSQERAKS